MDHQKISRFTNRGINSWLYFDVVPIKSQRFFSNSRNLTHLWQSVVNKFLKTCEIVTAGICPWSNTFLTNPKHAFIELNQWRIFKKKLTKLKNCMWNISFFKKLFLHWCFIHILWLISSVNQSLFRVQKSDWNPWFRVRMFWRRRKSVQSGMKSSCDVNCDYEVNTEH